MSPRIRSSVACLVFAAVACASGQRVPETVRVAPEELLAGTALNVAAESAHIAEEREVLAVDAQMAEFLDAHVARKAAADLKLHQLVNAIIDSGTFRIDYEAITHTASETFHMRRGNCFSFSTMFAAMARHVGIDARYQEVDIPPDWTLSNDTFVLNQHVNLYVDLGPAGKRIVDFNIGDLRSSYDMRTISDARALAHYYNNIAVEWMQAGDTVSALASFRKAIAQDNRQYSPAWTNLGTLYVRHGNRDYAEAAYLQALRTNADDLVAMSDLARLYELSGHPERAVAYRSRVLNHRRLNPYYRYELARRAYAARQYDEAIGHLKFAVRQRPKEDRFYSLLGLVYFQKGNVRAAEHWMAAAENAAATASLKHEYSQKIETLLRGAKR